MKQSVLNAVLVIGSVFYIYGRPNSHNNSFSYKSTDSRNASISIRLIINDYIKPEDCLLLSELMKLRITEPKIRLYNEQTSIAYTTEGLYLELLGNYDDVFTKLTVISEYFRNIHKELDNHLFEQAKQQLIKKLDFIASIPKDLRNAALSLVHAENIDFNKNIVAATSLNNHQLISIPTQTFDTVSKEYIFELKRTISEKTISDIKLALCIFKQHVVIIGDAVIPSECDGITSSYWDVVISTIKE